MSVVEVDTNKLLLFEEVDFVDLFLNFFLLFSVCLLSQNAEFVEQADGSNSSSSVC